MPQITNPNQSVALNLAGSTMVVFEVSLYDTNLRLRFSVEVNAETGNVAKLNFTNRYTATLESLQSPTEIRLSSEDGRPFQMGTSAYLQIYTGNDPDTRITIPSINMSGISALKVASTNIENDVLIVTRLEFEDDVSPEQPVGAAHIPDKSKESDISAEQNDDFDDLNGLRQLARYERNQRSQEGRALPQQNSWHIVLDATASTGSLSQEMTILASLLSFYTLSPMVRFPANQTEGFWIGAPRIDTSMVKTVLITDFPYNPEVPAFVVTEGPATQIGGTDSNLSEYLDIEKSVFVVTTGQIRAIQSVDNNQAQIQQAQDLMTKIADFIEGWE